MRPLLSIRFLAAVGALVVLALLAWFALPREGTSAQWIGSSASSLEREIDLLSPVFKTTAAPGFAVEDGVTTTRMVLHLDARRRLQIAAGTPGEVTCTKLGEISQCAVAAQLLGDAVVWFALVPALPRNTLVLPGIRSLREGNKVVLYNGWVITRSSIIERVCATDSDSLTDFISRFGSKATSTFVFDRQQVFRVTCPDTAVQPTGTSSTTVTTTTVFDPGPDVSILDENDPVGEPSPPDTAVAPDPPTGDG